MEIKFKHQVLFFVFWSCLSLVAQDNKALKGQLTGANLEKSFD